MTRSDFLVNFRRKNQKPETGNPNLAPPLCPLTLTIAGEQHHRTWLPQIILCSMNWDAFRETTTKNTEELIPALFVLPPDLPYCLVSTRKVAPMTALVWLRPPCWPQVLLGANSLCTSVRPLFRYIMTMDAEAAEMLKWGQNQDISNHRGDWGDNPSHHLQPCMFILFF